MPSGRSGPGRGRLARAVRAAGGRAGNVMTVAGVASLAWAALAAAPHGAIIEASASTGPPCGSNELCIKTSQVPTTATGFSGGSCGDLVSNNPSEDLWHFVIPDGAGFDTDTAHFSAYFSGVSSPIHADSIGGPNNKMAYVYSPAGATLTWAFATNVNGTAVQGYFVLSGTCPASQSSTTTTTSTTTSKTTTTTSSSVTGSQSGTQTSAASGGVQGISTTTSGPSGGVAGIIAVPSTGAGGATLLGVALLVGGAVSLGAAAQRRRR